MHKESELCVNEKFVIRLNATATGMLHITVMNVSNLLRMEADGDKIGK
jgi:hypothetical protein